MIFVAEEPLLHDQCSPLQGTEILESLMDHPAMVSASISFRDGREKVWEKDERKREGLLGRGIRHVYVFQREFATVDPRLVDFIGTDEATTCVGLVIRNQKNGMTSVAHLDSLNVVEGGISQMLSEVVDPKIESEFDVHLIGGYEDASSQQTGTSTKYDKHGNLDGYSLPLCVKLVEVLGNSRQKFHIKTLFVLGHNTRRDSEGNRRPIFGGFVVETSSGLVFPARFDNTTRCPDEVVRRIRVSASSEDPHWKGKLLETYNWRKDQFVIAPCQWTWQFVQIVSQLRRLPDSEVLPICSTSPDCEGPDFMDNNRKMWDYLIRHPNWKETFRLGRSRVFNGNDGEWAMVDG